MVCRRAQVTMEKIRVLSLEKLRRVLEDVELMKPVYSQFIGRTVVDASMDMYPHDGGADVGGERYWIYVTVRGSATEYDAALWKVVKYSACFPEIFLRLLECLSIEEEKK